MLLLKHYLLFTWNSNVTGRPVFFVRPHNPTTMWSLRYTNTTSLASYWRPPWQSHSPGRPNFPTTLCPHSWSRSWLEKNSTPLNPSHFRFRTANLKRGLHAAGRSTLLYRLLVRSPSVFLAFVSLLKPTTLSFSSFSGSCWTENRNPRDNSWIPLTTYLHCICIHPC